MPCLFIPTMQAEMITQIVWQIMIEAVKIIVANCVYCFIKLIENQGGISL